MLFQLYRVSGAQSTAFQIHILMAACFFDVTGFKSEIAF